MKQVFESALLIRPVSEMTAREYSKNIPILCLLVDEKLSSHPSLLELIGIGTLDIMKMHHQYSARFMSNILFTNHYLMLARITIWAYRSYRARGFSYEYFLVELCAWIEAVDNMLPFTEAQEINNIYKWMLDHHKDFIQLADSADYRVFPVASKYDQMNSSLLEVLLRGDARTFLSMSKEVLAAPQGLETLYTEVMQPCMYRIGELWEKGEITVAHEHLATATVERVMSMLYASYIAKYNKTKGRALITTVADEIHVVGVNMVADMLERDGWYVDLLGAQTPVKDLVVILKERCLDVLGLSVSMAFNLNAVKEVIQQVKKDLLLANTKIIVGGPAFAHSPDIWQTTGADAYAQDANSVIILANQWRGDQIAQRSL